MNIKIFACILFVFCNLGQANEVPITARSWLVADDSGKVISGINTNNIRSIASITKLMTVMVVLDAKQPLDEIIPRRILGQQFSRRELIDFAIVRSNNDAARILCEFYISGYDECIISMNAKAMELGMKDTHFTDPTGLKPTNVSTAADLIKLVAAASKYPEIVEASNKPTFRWPTPRNRWIVVKNTNPIVGKEKFFVSKTGFINQSGGCIVMMINTINGIRTVVLLGSKNTKTRIPEAQLISTFF